MDEPEPERPLPMPLLCQLADGEFHSGPALAAALGVRPEEVAGQVSALAELGLIVESTFDSRYRVMGGIDLLDETSIRAALTAPVSALLGGLVLRPVVDSTNAEALRQLAAGAPCRRVYSAEQQRAGRGRRGRAWVSPFASSLYLSLTWEFFRGAAALEGLSLAVGVAVVRALSAIGVPELQLKWPNDVLSGGAKLGGILLEMVGDATGRCQVVIGVGLNVAMPASAAATIEQHWTDIATVLKGSPPDRNALMAGIMNELLPLAARFETEGFDAWREEWLPLDLMRDQRVFIEGGGCDRQTGIARGVDRHGGLLLETAAGVRAIYGGEISLRLQP